MMGYRVYYIHKNAMVSEDYKDADRVRVVQNHLHLFQGEDNCLAIYQSGWWVKTIRIEKDE